MPASVVCSDLAFAWPNGDVVLSGLALAVPSGLSALVGDNGTGKSTLLRLVAGELAPTGGSVVVRGRLGYLPQDVTLAAGRTVDDVLGIRPVRAALAALELGEATEAVYAAIGDDWDAEERTTGVLAALGLASVGLDRRIGELSGGEAVLLGLAAQLLAQPDVLLLDEPTNNLDLATRRRLHEAVATRRGTTLVVSHDRELLALVDHVLELREGSIRTYGGNLAAYEAAVAAEQEAAERVVRAAESEVRRQRRDLVEMQTKLARRARYGRAMRENKVASKATLDEWKRKAQVTAGKQRTLHEEKVREARERLTSAESAVRDGPTIRVDLPGTAVPSARRVLEIREAVLRNGARVTLSLVGPERVALLGRNGSGKTTLLRALTGELPPRHGWVDVRVPVRCLPQRLDVLDDELSVVQNVSRFAPTAAPNDVRALLARFLFRGPAADRAVATLSGGERFRATLAALLLAQPAPQLLLLDEPTNNLDMRSVEQLVDALRCYRGALVVASHDLPFLQALGIARWVELDDELREVTAPPVRS
ncbi:MAG: ABC-F family ATP-binding cassette domain-containing protein [Frankiaceae bacterium]